jgi:ABC-2 type transport system permease protein
MVLRRYARLLGVQLRASFLQAAQYRVDFLLGLLLSACWTAAALVPLLVVYERRPTLGGWTRDEALLVVGFFTLLKGAIQGVIEPSVTNTVEHLRKGTLDFLLLKPVDAEFLVSTTRLQPWRATDSVGGLALIVWGLYATGRIPGLDGILGTVALVSAALAILHSLWVLVVALAFVTVKVDNLTFLLGSVYDAARWPSSVWRGALAWVFTLIIPLTVMTTWPALAVLGRLDLARGVAALALAAVFVVVSRAVWSRAIRGYTSAGG